MIAKEDKSELEERYFDQKRKHKCKWIFAAIVAQTIVTTLNLVVIAPLLVLTLPMVIKQYQNGMFLARHDWTGYSLGMFFLGQMIALLFYRSIMVKQTKMTLQNVVTRVSELSPLGWADN